MVHPGESVLRMKIKMQYNKGNIVGWTKIFVRFNYNAISSAHFGSCSLKDGLSSPQYFKNKNAIQQSGQNHVIFYSIAYFTAYFTAYFQFNYYVISSAHFGSHSLKDGLSSPQYFENKNAILQSGQTILFLSISILKMVCPAHSILKIKTQYCSLDKKNCPF